MIPYIITNPFGLTQRDIIPSAASPPRSTKIFSKLPTGRNLVSSRLSFWPKPQTRKDTWTFGMQAKTGPGEDGWQDSFGTANFYQHWLFFLFSVSKVNPPVSGRASIIIYRLTEEFSTTKARGLRIRLEADPSAERLHRQLEPR